MSQERIETLKAEHFQRRGERQVRLDAIAVEQQRLQNALDDLATEAQAIHAMNIIDAKATERVIEEFSEG